MTGVVAAALRTARSGVPGLAAAGVVALGASGCTSDSVGGGDSGDRGRTHVPANSRTHEPRPAIPPPVIPPPGATDAVHDKSGNAVAGVPLGVSVPFGLLDVRATEYRAHAFPGTPGTRVDVVMIRECAERGSVRVDHRTWRLVGAQGATLGTAGGKLVNGSPTEDLPHVLAAGECQTTELTIGVPASATPAAVQDGPRDLWVLPEA